MKLDIQYNTIESVAGPLVVVGKVKNASYNEIVRIKLHTGEERLGQVLETTDQHAVVQVFGPTNGIDVKHTSVSFLGETFTVRASEDMLGRVFDGQGRPKDSGGRSRLEEKRDINGEPINPSSRGMPSDFIETGISTIDGLNTLGKGAEASALLRVRTSAQRAHRADNKAGEGQGHERELRGGIRRHRDNL